MIRSPTRVLAAIGASIAWAAAALAQAIPASAIDVSPGPVARALERLTADVAAAKLPAHLRVLAADDPRWSDAATWRAWADRVRALARADDAEPELLAALVIDAYSQQRIDDAWDHFARLERHPAHLAALLPLFVPGVSHSAASTGGVARGVASDAILRPTVPPPPRPARELALGRPRFEDRHIQVTGIEIGGARLTMRVALESDGVQVDLLHQSGPAVDVRVALPELVDFELWVEYVDWFRQDTVREPLAVRVAPGDEPHQIFGRYRPRRVAWPSELPERLPRGVERDGLVLAVAASDPERARLEAIARGLATLLELPCAVGDGPPAAVRVELANGPDRALKLATVLSLSERWVLR